MKPSGSNQGLPAELQFFLSSDQIRSVLIRGAPGSGRSLLAHALLEAYDGDRLYVADARSFDGKSPNASEAGARPPTRYVSMEEFQTPTSPSDFSRALGVLRDPGTGRRRLSDVLGPTSGASAPPELTTPDRQMVVIDRWRAFVENLRAARMARGHHTPLLAEEEERGMLRALLGRVDKVVVVSREGSDSAIDDLSDGIVETHQSFVEDRMERWLRLVKMRGIVVERSFHPFTVAEGAFWAFPEFRMSEALHGSQAEVDPTPDAATLWPGSGAMARAFGRFPSASITLIEVDPQVPFEVQYMLSVPFIISTIRAQGRVSAIPPPMIRPDRVWEMFIQRMTPERIAEIRQIIPSHLRVLSHFGAGASDPEFAKAVVPLRPPSARRLAGPPLPQEMPSAVGEIPFDSPRPRFPHLFNYTSENPAGSPNAVVIYIDGLVAAAREIGSGYTPGALAAVLQREVAGYPLHIMVWSSEGDPLVRPLQAIAGLHLRLRGKQGHFFLHGVRPWTSNFIVQPAEIADPESAPFALIPIR